MSQGFNPFAGLGMAKPGLSAVYVQPGEHVFDVKKLKLIVSKKPGKVGTSSFVAEFDVVESTVHPKGSKVSWAVSLAQGDRALGDVKAFLMGVTGFDEKDVDDAIAAAAVHDSNPFATVRIGCTAQLGGVDASAGKKGFTRCAWRLVRQPEDLADRIVKAAAA